MLQYIKVNSTLPKEQDWINIGSRKVRQANIHITCQKKYTIKKPFSPERLLKFISKNLF